jgi:uncharacterized membrane protein YeaQ/YmgE (transglycosylase-associated protein family)
MSRNKYSGALFQLLYLVMFGIIGATVCGVVGFVLAPVLLGLFVLGTAPPGADLGGVATVAPYALGLAAFFGLVVGVIVGGAIGAIAGLFVPNSEGSDSRRDT